MFETQIWTAKILFFSEIPKYYWIFFHFLAFFFSFGPLSLSFSSFAAPKFGGIRDLS